MRGTSRDPQNEPVEEPDSDLGTQPHYRFTRQPVKYYRHHNPGIRLPNPSHTASQSAAPARGSPGSADSSRSSSPEPGTPRIPQNLDVHYENTHLSQKATNAMESKVDVPLSPREVVEYMLGLDSTFTSAAAATLSSTTQESAKEEVPRCQADRNINLNNSRQSTGQRPALCQSPKTLNVEHSLSSPAQKILSGLKLRRSHSGKDEQLFV